MREKPKYNTLQCLKFMLGCAWNSRRRVPFMCVLTALLVVGQSLAQLFLAPMILQKVEQSAPLEELLGTIGGFTLILLLLAGIKQYTDENALYSRIDVRSYIVNAINHKACTTSYPNTLDPAVMKLNKRAKKAVGSNWEPTEHIWTTLTELLTNVAGFCLYLLLLKNLNVVLLAVVLITTTVGFFVTRRIREWGYRHREEEALYQKKLNYIRTKTRSVELAKEIRIFGLQDWLGGVHDSVARLYEGFVNRRERAYLWANVVDVALSLARNGIAYFYLLRMALFQGLPASQFLLYFTAISGFTAWVTGILGKMADLHKECLEISSVQEYLNLPEPFCFEGGKAIPAAKAWELRLEHVSFRYPGAEADTIREMDLTIHPGEKLAIVGMNGAGKTTLVKLLCGFYDPTKGRVLLNGQDIREFDRQKYYELFSAVFQEYSNLDVTVAENVAQAVEQIDRAKVAECLEKAGLTETVEALPQGMDTHVGRKVYLDGVLFSGGQTQRLMLARALYKDGAVLVLDEPTAALDPLAENDIYMKYNEMTSGKTSVFISHRLASTRFCDRILFLKDGDIAEQGTHEELLALGGGYAELFEVQSRYYREGRDF